ncbi:MAG: TraB/GumN family protein [Pseudomonadota bacterium]
MRRLGAALFVALAWAFVAYAQPAPAPQGPALWRIHDADSEIWLFGSVHVLPAGLAWRSARIDAAFRSADEIVMETDATSASGQQTFAQLTARLGMLPAGKTLNDLLTPRERQRLARAAAGAHIDSASLQPLRPWLAALRLSLLDAMAHGQDPSSGVEPIFARDAEASHKRISYFETPEQQLHVLADLSPADEMRFFTSTLDDIEHDSGAMDNADRAWVRGDTRALARLLDPEMHEAGPGVYAALITRRNAHWVDEIQHRLAGSGRIFIVVGSAHLVGPNSVVALLRARGVHIEGP